VISLAIAYVKEWASSMSVIRWKAYLTLIHDLFGARATWRVSIMKKVQQYQAKKKSCP